MQRLVTFMLLWCIGGCTYTNGLLPPLPTQAGTEMSLLLYRADDGGLRYCEDEQDESTCRTFPNPGNCATLEVVITRETGKTCEFCFDSKDEIKTQGCAYTNVACTLITAPEPDCIVCAFVGGAVIFSSCEAAAPECYLMTTASDPDGCEICYDASGRPVINNCPIDCGSVACPDVLCGPESLEIRSAGDCCPSCVPVGSCDREVCAMVDYRVPECPEGMALVRDPADCCYYYCEGGVCPGESDDPNGTSGTAKSCPPGFDWVQGYPECGQCVPAPAYDAYCLTSEECGQEEICTNALGECLPNPECDPAGDSCGAYDVCYGVCRPEWGCDIEQNLDTPPLPICEGELRFDGIDIYGCPRTLCVCEGGIVSVDGTCPDLCAGVNCFQVLDECADGERLVTDFPNCCGVCVPDGTCVAGEDTASGTISDNGDPIDDTMGCPDVECAPGFHLEIGLQCCEVCIRDETGCDSDSDCLGGESCIRESDSSFCMQPVACWDGDGGINPFAASGVTGWTADGEGYSLEDHCLDNHSVVEAYCFAPYNGSSQSTATVTVITCENGCSAGACQ